jgi:Major Facilitator Superfamily
MAPPRAARRRLSVHALARDPRRLTRAYYLYQATATCTFFTPIFFLYYQEVAGLGMGTVLWLQSWAVGVRALLDLPFGALADRWSRRGCLLGSALAFAAGATVLLARPTLWMAVVAESAFAAGAALKSGADSALLFDALQRADRLDLYPRAESRGQAVVSLASGATAIVGGLLAAVDLRLPYVATVAAAVASGAFALRLRDDGRGPHGHLTLGRLLGEAGRLAPRRGVRWVIALAAAAITWSHVYFYLQQPYLRDIGVPVALFGVVFAATKAVTALVANGAHRIDARLGARGTAAIMALAPALGLGAMSVATGPAAALLILSRGVLDGLWQPLANVYMNRLVGSHLRATMLSFQSLVARLVLAAAIAVAGAGVARVGLAATLGAAAAVAVVVGGLLAAGAPADFRTPGEPWHPRPRS